MISAQQIRAVLAGRGRVVDGAGHSVGRILHVLLDVRTVEPAHVTVDCDLCEGVAVVPLARARVVDGCLQVPYTAADICGAPRVYGAAGRFDPQPVEELDRYYVGLDDGARAGRTPEAAGNGHRRLNGARLGSLAVMAGIGVHAGRDGYDGPAAYPATSVGPWPPVTTSSAGPPWWQRRQSRWPSVPSAIRLMRLEVRALLDSTRIPDQQREDLVLAAGEAASNAVEHARFPTVPFFDVLTEVGEDWARIVVQDHGRWRPPIAGGGRGRGLQMMGVLADATLTVGAGGTTVVLQSRLGVPS